MCVSSQMNTPVTMFESSKARRITLVVLVHAESKEGHGVSYEVSLDRPTGEDWFNILTSRKGGRGSDRQRHARTVSSR